MEEIEFSELIGKVITEINKQSDRIYFICKNEHSLFKNVYDSYVLYHDQDCCETVCIEDVNGDLDDLIDTPILQAEERVSHENPEDFTPEYQNSFTWTFYHLATIKGYVTIRFYGSSNGYYSERVSFSKEEYKHK